MGYRKEVIKGISWIGFLRLATKAVGFLEAIILARILIPEQFGAYGIALLSLGLLEVLTESGVNIVLMQEENIDSHISSAWVVSILRGIVICFILLLISPIVSSFFHSPESLILLNTISLVPLLRGFINPAIVKLQKDLYFRKDFLLRFSVLIIDTFVSVLVTFVTKNPIGIVVGLVTGVLAELIFSFVLISPKPTFKFKESYVKKIFHRGKWITASSIFDYLFHNADNIAVGRLLGAKALGIYQLAYALAAIPLIEVGRVFVHVTTPILIKIKDDTPRLRSALISTVVSIGIIVFPFTLLFALLHDMFILLLGPKWAGVAVILPILAVFGFVKSVSLASTALFLSKNKQEYSTVVTFSNIIGLSVSIVPLVLSYGLFGAGLSALIGTACSIPVIVYYTDKILNT